MNKNVIFSIVAKNYLPLAFALGESVLRLNSDVDFCILLADSKDDLIVEEQPYKVYLLEDLGLPAEFLCDMEFKYNVTEFCTSVKPYFFNFMFDKGYEKAIYFDPDIFTFKTVQPIFDELQDKSIVVTPHYLTPEINYTGLTTESLILHGGGFNFGFIAVANSTPGLKFIQWWMNRLHDKCYQDKIESLHTDQKWGDLIPSLFTKDLLISDDLGRNMAFWNLHERNLSIKNGDYVISNRILGNTETVPLMFFHFAGYDISASTGRVHKNHPEYMLEQFPELNRLFNDYGKALYQNGYEKYIKFRYGFDFYENDELIQPYQRRLYRRLIMDGMAFRNPFLVNNGSFYKIIERNGLLGNKENKNIGKSNEFNLIGFEGKLSKLNFLMTIAKKILGADKYFLLLKFMQRYARAENQSFLIKEAKKNYYFINENRDYSKLNQVK